MNPFIQSQINNMLFMLANFEQSCKYAALKDDKQISRAEQITLKKIQKATEKYRKELQAIK